MGREGERNGEGEKGGEKGRDKGKVRMIWDRKRNRMKSYPLFAHL